MNLTQFAHQLVVINTCTQRKILAIQWITLYQISESIMISKLLMQMKKLLLNNLATIGYGRMHQILLLEITSCQTLVWMRILLAFIMRSHIHKIILVTYGLQLKMATDIGMSQQLLQMPLIHTMSN